MIWKKILSLTLFKIITVSESSTLLRVFLMGRSGCPTKGENLVGLPVRQKIWAFILCFISSPLKNEPFCPLITDYILEKRVSLIAFRNILSKFFFEACIFSNTIVTYLIKLVGTKSLNTKECPAGLSLGIIPHYLCKHLWESLGMGKNPTQQAKVYSFRPPEKSPFINFPIK